MNMNCFNSKIHIKMEVKLRKMLVFFYIQKGFPNVSTLFCYFAVDCVLVVTKNIQRQR